MAADRRRARQEALVRALEAEALDGLVVTSHANIRYLTGFSGSAAVVAVTRADVLLVTDFRYDEQARAEAAAVARVEVDSTSVWDRFFRELATLGRSARWATRPTRCRCTMRSGSRRRGRRGAGCPPPSWWSGCARRRTTARWRPSAAPRCWPARRYARRSRRCAPA